ncbi:scarecrow-like protein 32 [Punica granatum]|uniref:Uncharacterized protein n=2 Tax=Punica granatum TaxID=22663 RepID=A0A218VZE9_PUNGR|nr:scarecrow-like protein 32 [Punica granatum]OWM65673.1 hypothetical protein CDL15_Pgr017170 [Punica granatum]PKI71291.1 hypothetical protein CRG98_008291 [Punica granatum]
MPFTETLAPHLLADMNNKNQVHRTRPWPGLFPAGPKTTFTSFGDANCMEQLLVHCANAIESNDATLAQQILWVLNNTAPPDGDSNQRLTCGFLRALIARAARNGSCKMLAAVAASNYDIALLHETHRFSVIELASFVDLTPWHRFGFTAANAAILEAVEGYSVIHIVDLSSTHCMQIPTLIDAIASRSLEAPPPIVKLTVAWVAEEDGHVPPPPPLLDDVSYEELGRKLVNFAMSRNVTLKFQVVHSSYREGYSTLIEHLRVQNFYKDNCEALVINCHMTLHYISEETQLTTLLHDPNPSGNNPYPHFEPSALVSPRTMFLKALRSLDPTIVVLVDEDADFTSNDLVDRLRSAFNYLWIPYDTVDTFLPKGSKQRQWYEADVCWKIENVIAHEGAQRIERVEPKSRWVQRMRSAGFRGFGFGEEAVSEVKSMLDEHAAGWGLKKEEEDHLVLTWKGHNVVFATAWLPT